MSMCPWRRHPFYDDPFGDLFSGPPFSTRIFDQHFGRGLFDGDPFFNDTMSMVPYWMRPRSVARSGGIDTGVSEIQNNKDKFRVRLDVSHFKPEEVVVKTVDDYLIIEGKHEEKMDEHGFVSRHFSRRCRLPQDVDPTTVVSSLNKDGVLCVEAPKKAVAAGPNERVIPIEPAKKSAVEGKK